jgi:A/G-specific adenine glycosylase
VLAIAGRRVLLERRPPRGIWGGLFVPPQFADAAAAGAFVAAQFGKAPAARRLPTLHHAFTHFDLDIEPWVVRLPGRAARVEEGGVRWHELGALDAVGLPAPMARLLEELRDGPNRPLREARPRGGRPRTPAVSR